MSEANSLEALNRKVEDMEKDFSDQLLELHAKIHYLTQFVQDKFGEACDGIKLEKLNGRDVGDDDAGFIQDEFLTGFKVEEEEKDEEGEPSKPMISSFDDEDHSNSKQKSRAIYLPSSTSSSASGNEMTEHSPSEEEREYNLRSKRISGHITKKYKQYKYKKPANDKHSQSSSGSSVFRRRKEFPCSWTGCEKVFYKKQHYISHFRTHSGEKPYICDWPGCGKCFTQSGPLQYHKRIHLGTQAKEFVCTWGGCGKSFMTSRHLSYHTMTHTGERPFHCDWLGCSKRFVCKSALRVHTKIHTGEKPFKCDWVGCVKSFAQNGQLQYHMASHTGEKFPCTVCGKLFRTITVLRYHEKVHINGPRHKLSGVSCQ